MPGENKSDVIERTLFEKIRDSAYIGNSRVVLTFGTGHPFDLVKTRMQANPNILSAVLLSKEIYNKTGIRGFYTAGVPNFTRAIFKESYRSPLRGGIKSLFTQHLPEFDSKKEVTNVATGITLAGTDTFLICPLERIKVWMMTNYTKDRGLPQFFKQAPGVSELFRGLRPAFARSGMSWVSYLVAEEKIWQKVRELSPRVNEADQDLPIAEQLLIGSLGGVVNCLCTLPFDTVKTQMQKRESIDTKKISTVMRSLYAEHGAAGLYAGWRVRLPHYAIVGVLTSHVIRKVDDVWASPANTKSPSP